MVRPFAGVDIFCCNPAGQPFVPHGLDTGECRRARHRRAFGYAGFEDPLPYTFDADRLRVIFQ
jgi:hypothetical protein